MPNALVIAILFSKKFKSFHCRLFKVPIVFNVSIPELHIIVCLVVFLLYSAPVDCICNGERVVHLYWYWYINTIVVVVLKSGGYNQRTVLLLFEGNRYNHFISFSCINIDCLKATLARRRLHYALIMKHTFRCLSLI